MQCNTTDASSFRSSKESLFTTQLCCQNSDRPLRDPQRLHEYQAPFLLTKQFQCSSSDLLLAPSRSLLLRKFNLSWFVYCALSFDLPELFISFRPCLMLTLHSQQKLRHNQRSRTRRSCTCDPVFSSNNHSVPFATKHGISLKS
jgi:hypothetical protein